MNVLHFKMIVFITFSTVAMPVFTMQWHLSKTLTQILLNTARFSRYQCSKRFFSEHTKDSKEQKEDEQLLDLLKINSQKLFTLTSQARINADIQKAGYRLYKDNGEHTLNILIALSRMVNLYKLFEDNLVNKIANDSTMYDKLIKNYPDLMQEFRDKIKIVEDKLEKEKLDIDREADSARLATLRVLARLSTSKEDC